MIVGILDEEEAADCAGQASDKTQNVTDVAVLPNGQECKVSAITEGLEKNPERMRVRILIDGFQADVTIWPLQSILLRSNTEKDPEGGRLCLIQVIRSEK
jgi:hypothetical protein